VKLISNLKYSAKLALLFFTVLVLWNGVDLAHRGSPQFGLHFGQSAYAAETTQYNYDALGRLISTTDAAGVTTDYTYDKVGNLKSVALRNLPTPAVDSFTPTSGQVGDTITIRGTNFNPSAAQNTIKFNGTIAAITSATATTILATVPVGATTGPISATTTQGTGTSASSFTVTQLLPPQVTGFSPSLVVQGGFVTMSGANFAATIAGNTVSVNGVNVTVTAATATSLTFQAPVLAVGGKVKVTTAGGIAISSTDLFIVQPPDMLTDIGVTGRLTYNGVSQSPSLPPSKIAMYLFEGVAGTQGTKIRTFDKTMYSVTVTVFGPNGVAVMPETLIYTTAGTVTLPALPTTGTYSVRLLAGSPGGSVSVALGTDIDYGFLTNGQAVDVATVAVRQVITASIAAVAGQTLSVMVSNLTVSSGTIQVRGPDGLVLSAETFLSGGGGVVIPTIVNAGTYRVELAFDAASAGAAKITLATRSNVDFGSLAFDGNKTLAVTIPGNVPFLTFNGTAGQFMGYEWSASTFTKSVEIQILKPDGSELLNSTIAVGNGLVSRFGNLPVTGIYTVKVFPQNGGLGSINFSVWTDVIGGTLVLNAPAFLAAAGTTHKAQQVKYQFSVAAGDVIGLEFNTTMTAAAATVYEPNGSYFTNFPIYPSLHTWRSPVFATAGTYIITVDPVQLGGSLEIKMWSDIDAGTMAVGDTKSITLLSPTQQANFTFSGIAGEKLGTQWLSPALAGNSLQYEVTAPSGALFEASGFSEGIIKYFNNVLPETGLYKVKFTPVGPRVGLIKFKLWRDVDAGAIVVDGAPKLGITLIEAGQQAKFTFVGTAGTVVGYEVSALTIPSGLNAVIKSPTGVTITHQATLYSADLIHRLAKLTETGTYTVQLIPTANIYSPYVGEIGSFNIKLWTDIDAGSVNFGASKDVVFTHSGQGARIKFNAVAGDRLGFEFNNNTPAIDYVYTITTATGTTIDYRPGNAGYPFTEPRAPGVLSYTGEYYVDVLPNSLGAGSVRFNLWKDVQLSLAIDAPLPTVISLPNSLQQSRLSFAGVAGQLLKITFTDVSLVNATGNGSVLVLDPAGNAITSFQTLSSVNGLVINLPALSVAGTYTIWAFPDSGGTGVFSVRVTTQ
jgi:YD repeat-containing protein